MCRKPIAVAALLVSSVLGPGQTAGGYEFRINTGTTSGAAPAVAMDAHGGFVVVWMAGTTIVGRRYDADGAPLGAEFPVSSPGNAFRPDVAADFDGNIVVAWTRVNGDSDSSDAVFARRHESTGNPRGPEFRVNTVTTGQQADPRVASDGQGGFVVVWEGHDGSFTECSLSDSARRATGSTTSSA